MDLISYTSSHLSYLAEKLSAVERYGLDYETIPKDNGPKDYALQHDLLEVLGVGFGFEDGDRTYIPLRHAVGKNASLSETLSLLEKVFSDPNKEQWAHNSKYETMVTRSLGIDPKNKLRCSMIAQWMLGYRLSGGRGLKLKPSVKHFLGHTMTEFNDVVPKKVKAQYVSPSTMGDYCSDDALQCLRLGLLFLPRLKHFGLLKPFYDLEMRFMPVLVHMQECGCYIDSEYLSKLHTRFSSEMEKIEDEFESIVGVGISKNAQISKKLYDDLKWWPKKGIKVGKSGVSSVDKESLKLVGSRLKEGTTPHNVLTLKQRYQAISKLASTYTLPLIEKAGIHSDGRVRGQFNQTGTDTGRLSCVSGSTKILTDCGELKIIDLMHLQKYKTFLTVTHTGSLKPIHSVFTKGVEKMYHVTLRNGYFIVCTLDHRFKTPDGWKKLRELKEGCALSTFSGYSYGVTNLKEKFGSDTIESIKYVGRQLVYDLSVDEDHSYVAEGFVNHNSTQPNLQNIPVRSEEGSLIRDSFIAEPGWSLCVADYSQADLVMMGHLSRDPMLLSAYREGRDLHQQTADKCSDNSGLDISRKVGKVCNLGLIYEMHAKTLAKNLGCDLKTGEIISNAWHSTYPLVSKYHEKQHRYASKYGFVRTITGRIRRVEDIDSDDFFKKLNAQRIAVNTPDQGSVSDVINLAMRNLYEDWKERGVLYDYYTGKGNAKIISQVHDEIIAELKNGFEEEGMRDIQYHMEHAVELRAPMVAVPGLGRSWNDGKNDGKRREEELADRGVYYEWNNNRWNRKYSKQI